MTEIAASPRLDQRSSKPTQATTDRAAVGTEGKITSPLTRVPSLWERVAAAVAASHRASVPF